MKKLILALIFLVSVLSCSKQEDGLAGTQWANHERTDFFIFSDEKNCSRRVPKEFGPATVTNYTYALEGHTIYIFYKAESPFYTGTIIGDVMNLEGEKFTRDR